MRGTHRFGLIAGMAVAATLLAGAGPASAAVKPFVAAGGALQDLAPTTADPTDGARARVFAITFGSSTYVLMTVSGLDRDAAGTTYGAHVHVGPCVAGNGAAAGPHYNIDGGVATEENEVWLDFTVLPGGYAQSSAWVPFQIESGDAQSVVIHALPTAPGGAAGARLACLPVAF
jgi:Cu/Zn superoxide dismutase